MKILKLFTLACIFFNTLYSYAQEESFKDKGTTFFIKTRSYFSKQLADSLNNTRSKSVTLEPVNPNDTSVVILDNVFEIAHYDRKKFTYFRINPKEYIYFNLRDLNDSIIYENNFTNISKVSRESLKQEIFQINNFKLLDYKFDAHTKEFSKNFKLVNLNEKNIRKIAGYNCYEVIFESETRILQLFVTKEIKLNYHPELNDPEILKKYYPLYIKIMSKQYPKRSFTESIFYEGLY